MSLLLTNDTAQFIDMCMLCGCDYLEPIKGVGPKTALKMVKEYESMEDILAHLRKGKNPPPEDWPYEEARQLFKTPSVKPASEIEVRCALRPLLLDCSADHLSPPPGPDHSSSGRRPTSRASSTSSCARRASRASTRAFLPREDPS